MRTQITQIHKEKENIRIYFKYFDEERQLILTPKARKYWLKKKGKIKLKIGSDIEIIKNLINHRNDKSILIEVYKLIDIYENEI